MQFSLFHRFVCFPIIVILIVNQVVHAEDLSISNECSEQESGSKSNRFDSVSVNIHPIFDENNPKENKWLFRLVNDLHINTQERVIKNDLLFKEGDLYNEKLFEQSERILRKRRYLNYASVSLPDKCQSNNHVQVDVKEVWTLVPGVNFSRAGGQNKYSFGLRDSNFLGLGKTLNFKHTKSTDRSGDSFEYFDPNTGFLNSTIKLQYEKNTDGVVKSIAIDRPFLELETKWATGVLYNEYTQEDALYNAGKEVNRFAHVGLNESIFYGFKINTDNDEFIQRVLFGYERLTDDFLSVGESPNASLFVPGNREFNYPWVEYQQITDNYIKAYNIRQLNRVEDINFGTAFRFRFGYASSPIDTFDGSYVFDGDYKEAISLSENQLVITNVNTVGYYNMGDFYNTKAQAKASYHWQNFERGQFYIGLNFTRGFRLFEDLPLEVGGDTGVRGYPSRYQAGDHLKVITVEQRYFGEKEWFSLFHMGAAVFYDEGRAWGESAIPQSQTGILRDVGVGLRFSGTRTGNEEEGTQNILHLDIAFPLDGGEDISKFQFVVKVKKGF